MVELRNRGDVEWVSINDVVPNPLNPRRNDAVKTDQMQSIIKTRGWEEPLTVYQRGRTYVILAGHRRHYAAKKAGIKEVPVYIVEAPKDHTEELERIASLQSGRVNWTSYEWAQFVYNRWLAWNKPPITRFGKALKLTPSTVERYIRVLDYYPRHEIEAGLINGTYSINILFELRQWMRRLESEKPAFVADLGEDMIRLTMLRKLDKKGLISINSMRNTRFLTVVSENDLREFLFDQNAELEAYQEQYHIRVEDEYASIHGYTIAISSVEKKVKNMAVKNAKEKERALKSLTALKESVERKLSELERKEFK